MTAQTTIEPAAPHTIGFVQLAKTGHNRPLCLDCGERTQAAGGQLVPLVSAMPESPSACGDCGRPLTARAKARA